MAGIQYGHEKFRSMKILICGLGSIGKRQARLLKNHFSHELFALRTGIGQEKNELLIPELDSWKEVGSFDAAFITNPTHRHLETAIECAGRGMHLFIEKPLDCKTKGLAELVKLVEERQKVAYVAYPLRFHPLIRKLKSELQDKKILHARMVCSSYLPDWRPSQDHKNSYSSYRSKGGGVILDLSHELDNAVFLFGDLEKIEGHSGRRSDLTVDAEDFADLILLHSGENSGMVTSVHLDYFGRPSQRIVEVQTADGFFKVDLISNTYASFQHVSGHLEETQDSIMLDRDELYLTQLRYFFENLQNSKRMENNLSEASRLFYKLIEFRGES